MIIESASVFLFDLEIPLTTVVPDCADYLMICLDIVIAACNDDEAQVSTLVNSIRITEMKFVDLPNSLVTLRKYSWISFAPE